MELIFVENNENSLFVDGKKVEGFFDGLVEGFKKGFLTWVYNFSVEVVEENGSRAVILTIPNADYNTFQKHLFRFLDALHGAAASSIFWSQCPISEAQSNGSYKSYVESVSKACKNFIAYSGLWRRFPLEPIPSLR
ncbi:MAG: hypothetical protein J6S85_17380 [Methanobrevibacter sp.]|nr:hypothetical protein [Methanobrevibacter sp.]